MRRLRPLIIAFVVAAACAACVATAPAQTSLTNLMPSAAPGATPLANGVRQEGLYFTAPISLDGLYLFRVATPLAGSSDQMPVATRAQFIQAALAQIVALAGSDPSSGTIYDPKSLQVTIQTAGDQAVLLASDAHHAAVPLLTVTQADAKYYRVPVQTLASQWQSKLQDAFVAGLEKRQPAELKKNYEAILRLGGVLVLLTLVIWLAAWIIGKQTLRLRKRVESDARELEEAQAGGVGATTPPPPTQRRRFMGLAIRASGPEMSLAVLRAFSAVLIWGLVLFWFLSIVWALTLFPQTMPIGRELLRRVREVAVIVVGTIVLMRVADIVINRIAHLYGEQKRTFEPDEHTRLLLRIPTIARALTAFSSFLFAFVAFLAVLGALGISGTSVLTLGGIAALGLSFAAQNLVRDFLNGFFVLFEDQYVVGDFVIIDAISGTVESMTLRVVQIRDAAGNLITIPHGQVAKVVNCSRNWSRVDYRIAVDAHADIARAIELLRTTIAGFAAEDAWSGAVIDAMEYIGVDSIAATGIVLRASIRTQPLQQFEIKREINARVVTTFGSAGIAFGLFPEMMGPAK
jgi:moderate conductance mechanosensitive channel